MQQRSEFLKKEKLTKLLAYFYIMEFELKIIKENYKKAFYVLGIIILINAYIVFNLFIYIKNFNYNINSIYIKMNFILMIVLILGELWLIQSFILIIFKKRKQEPYYIINKNGFYFKGIYKATNLEWDTIEKCEIVKFRGVDMLRLYLKDEKKLYEQYTLIMKIFYKINTHMLHGNGFIFDLASFEGKEMDVIENIKLYCL